MSRKQRSRPNVPSRREFIKRSSLLVAGGAVGGGLTVRRAAHASGTDEIRIALVGCGRRGTRAAIEALNTAKSEHLTPNGPVKLIALADAFPDRIQSSYRAIRSRHGDWVDVPAERRFAGFDGYQRVLECDIHVVILATPPGFRPLHFEAAVRAGKHVFLEKPCATDAPGVRRLLAANEQAKRKGLAVATGFHRRHERRYQETMARLHDGAIGRIVYTRVYWNGGDVPLRPRRPGQSELVYQLRNWHHFRWLGGDPIVERHIHNLDVINWLMGDHPIECRGAGGRLLRTGTGHGQVFDHHFCEFVYEDGTRMFSQCRQIRGCWNHVSERAHGTDGSADISGAKIYDTEGRLVWRSTGGSGGHQEEQNDLFAALRRGEIYNEGDEGAASTMTAILGRMATYSGQVIRWDDVVRSQTALADFDRLESLEEDAPVMPDRQGRYPLTIPGRIETA